jgi:hypothetical protein
MCGSKVHNESASTRGPEAVAVDPRRLEKVRAIFTSLAKYINAKTIYTANNPNVANFARAFNEAFRSFFADEKVLVLTIEQHRITWHGEVIYGNNKKTESIAFLLFKDGVGEISFHAPVTPDELEQFVDLLRDEIYNPSVHLDIVSRLWQAEFKNISYRVFDETADAASGQGKGSGGESREEPTRANDHRELPGEGERVAQGNARTDEPIESLGAYFAGMVERTHRGAGTHEKEKRLQSILESFYTVSAEELEPWREELASAGEGNRLLQFLEIMIDFTTRRNAPSAARDVRDIIDRLLRYVVEESDIPTLIGLLDVQRNAAGGRAPVDDFESLPGRIEDQLHDEAFMISLGKAGGRPPEDVRALLRFFTLIGMDAVPGVRELLANVTDPALHGETCDTLIAIAGDDAMGIVGGFDLDDPQRARDAVYVARRSGLREVPPVIKKLVAFPEPRVRMDVIEYVADLRTDEAAALLCELLDDDDVNVRMRAFAAAGEFRHQAIVDKVAALCFAKDFAEGDSEELEHMFRAVGKLAGENALPSIKRMINGRGWFPSARSRGRQNKLLAATALRYVPGAESLKLLNRLASDRDNLVRTKALYVLKQLDATPVAPGGDEGAAGGTTSP